MITSKRKGILVTVLITILLVVLAADVVSLWPGTLVWILGVFAVPGVVLFSKVLYRWLTEEDEPVKVYIPSFTKGTQKSYAWYKRQREKEDAELL